MKALIGRILDGIAYLLVVMMFGWMLFIVLFTGYAIIHLLYELTIGK